MDLSVDYPSSQAPKSSVSNIKKLILFKSDINMSIRRKMILILLVCTTIPMLLVGLMVYYHARETLQSLRMEELKSIADLKAKRIEDFFADQKNHIMIAQQRPTLKKYASILAEFSGDTFGPVYETIIDELDQALACPIPYWSLRLRSLQVCC